MADRQVFTFNDDGTMLEQFGPQAFAGSYQASVTEVTLVNTSYTETTPYLIAGAPERLLLSVLTRRDGSGATGTWQRTLTVDGHVRTLTLVLRADQSAHVAKTLDADPASEAEGRWARTTDDLEVVTSETPETTYRFTMVNDHLGNSYERL